MRVAFILHVLNAAEHLAGLLLQTTKYGEVVVIESVDPFNDVSESRRLHSVDATEKIVEKFSDVVFMRLGKVGDPRHALNKALGFLNSANYFIILRQGDFFLDIEQLLYELEGNDVITTKRLYFWKNFQRFFVGQEEELAFRNLKDLVYKDSITSVSFHNGARLSSLNLPQTSVKRAIVNLRYVTSPSKIHKLRIHEERVEKFYESGILAAKNVKTFEEPSSLCTAEDGDFMTDLKHPWKGSPEKFFESLPSFPSITLDDWEKCINGKTPANVQYEIETLKALGLSDSSLRKRFEAEGWDCDGRKDKKHDLVYSIGKVPDLYDLESTLNPKGRVVVLDAPGILTNSRYTILFLEERSGRYSFVAKRR